MITSENLTRRSFLSGLLYFSALGFPPLGRDWDRLHASDQTNILAAKLVHVYTDKHSAKIVGLEYLRIVPTEAKVDILIDLIVSCGEAQRDEFSRADKQQLMELLQLQQCQDFEHGHVVNVRGWLLSETECRLCALAALI